MATVGKASPLTAGNETRGRAVDRGMSTTITIEAVVPHGAGMFDKMVRVRDACADAGVDLPEEVSDFFEDEDANGDVVTVTDLGRLYHCRRKGSPEYGDGAYVDLSKLPEGTTHIRVAMS